MIREDSTTGRSRRVSRTDIRARVRHARLALFTGFVYSVSLWKYIKRPPLSSSLGFEALLETGSVAMALLITILMARHASRRYPPQSGLIYLGVFGVFTVASAFRSFSPALSLTKSALLFAVLGMTWILAQMDLTWSFLKGLYAGYVSIAVLGLCVSVVLPARYPLIISEAWTHRNRLTLFDMHPNSVADTTAVMFLLGRILGGRWRWLPQLLLVGLNLLAGEKTATAALLLIGTASYVLERPWNRTRTIIMSSVVAWIALAGVLAVTGVVRLVPDQYITSTVSAIYGDKVGNELSTLDGRAAVWKRGEELASNGTLLGYGLEGARAALIGSVYWSGQAHNGLLEAVLDGGVLGAMILIVGWTLTLLTSLRGVRTWIVRAGALHGMILILALIGPIFTFYSFVAEALIISLAYEALGEAHERKIRAVAKLSGHIPATRKSIYA